MNGISINLNGYDDGEIFPLCISKFEHAVDIDMLILKDETKSHYVWIKNLSRFLSHLIKHDGVLFVCLFVWFLTTHQPLWVISVRRY